VGVLQRFERRLEGLVEGAFARVFKGFVQPVEVAAALQREAAHRKAIVGQGRVLVPNSYVVELSPADSERLLEYDAPLRAELASMVEEHAAEQGWSFVGPVEVQLRQVDEVDTGVFRVRSTVVAAAQAPQAVRADFGGGRARLVLPGSGGSPERVVPLDRPVTLLGRGTDADVRLADTGVSRRHAEIAVQGGTVTLSDLGSTNGTLVNGRRVDRAVLTDGDRLELGASALVFRQGA
jgi:hypothetical protein